MSTKSVNVSSAVVCCFCHAQQQQQQKIGGSGVRGAEVEKIEEPCWIYYSTVAISQCCEAWVGKFALIFFCPLSLWECVLCCPLSLLSLSLQYVWSGQTKPRSCRALLFIHTYISNGTRAINCKQSGREGRRLARRQLLQHMCSSHTHTLAWRRPLK